MATKISFKNFKSFGNNFQSFSKKPITLVYGANSVGKSSVLHALLYMKFISHFKGLDLKKTTLFGDKLDLGGFDEIVYKKDFNNSIEYSLIIDDKEEIDDLLSFPPFKKTYANTIKLLKIDIIFSKKSQKSKIDIVQKVYINNALLYSKHNSRITIDSVFQDHDQFIKSLDILIKYLDVEGFRIQYIGPLRFYPNRNELKFNNLWLKVTNFIKKYRNKITAFVYGSESAVENPIIFMDLQKNKLANFSIKNVFQDMFHNASEIKNFQPLVLLIKFLILIVLLLLLSIIRLFDKPSKWIFLYLTYIETSYISFKQGFFSNIFRILFISNSQYNLSKKESKNMWLDLFQEEEKREKLNKWLTNSNKLKSNYRLEKNRKELYFKDLQTNLKVHPREMGLGISQMLPILYSCLCTNRTEVFIEQPELHLHPAAQSELADAFIQGVNENNNRFMIETHSEHLLLRMMKRMRQTHEGTIEDENLKLTPDDIALLYVDTDGENTYILELELDEDGTLLDPWPGGFFEEGFNERFF